MKQDRTRREQTLLDLREEERDDFSAYRHSYREEQLLMQVILPRTVSRDASAK